MLGQSEAKDNLDSARQGFEAILAKEPKHLHARFCLGMYYQHVGDMEKTLECFQAVYEGDPDDSYVGYKYAEGAAERRPSARSDSHSGESRRARSGFRLRRLPAGHDVHAGVEA